MLVLQCATQYDGCTTRTTFGAEISAKYISTTNHFLTSVGVKYSSDVLSPVHTVAEK